LVDTHRAVYSIAYSPSGELAIGTDKGVCISGHMIPLLDSPVYHVMWLDRETLASATSTFVRIWNREGERLFTLGTNGFRLAYHAPSERLAVIDEEGALRLFDRCGNFLSLPWAEEQFGAVGFYSSGTLVAAPSMGRKLYSCTEDGNTHTKEVDYRVTAIATHTDVGTAFGTSEGEIVLPSGRVIPAHTKAVTDLQFSPSGTEIYSVGGGVALRVKIS
jgi:WD40 repeat protein